METFRTRLIDAMRMRCVSAADLSRQSGLSKAQISQYVNGKVEARQNALHRLAVALNVSESWLMGNDVPLYRVDLTPSLEDQMKVALFGGDGEVTDEMWNEVKAFAEFVKQKYKR